MSIVGETYLERGEPVVVIAQWRNRRLAELPDVFPPFLYLLRDRGAGPRNVLIRRADGDLVVRPFRGLRRPRGPRDSGVEGVADSRAETGLHPVQDH